MIPAFGYALRGQSRSALTDETSVTASEIDFEQADEPLRLERYLGSAKFDYVSVHSRILSPGSHDLPPRRCVESIKAIALENDAKAISDHLGFTRAGQDGIELGHVVPMPFTLGAVEACCRNIERLQQHFDPLHFYLENPAYLFRFDGEMGEAEFMTRILSRTGCGWLLDLTNVHVNAVNFRFDPYDFIGCILPEANRVQMHLSGCSSHGDFGTYVGSHSHPIPEEIWNLYRFALEQAGTKVEAVFIEKDDAGDFARGTEVARAREIAIQIGHEQDSLQRAG